MAFTAQAFAKKLQGLRLDRDDNIDAMAAATGIAIPALQALEAGKAVPTGDEVLIIAGYFSTDFAWLIDDDAQDPDSNARAAARAVGGELGSADRHAIADFMHLCRSQAILEDMLGRKPKKAQYSWAPPKRFGMLNQKYRDQGIRCAAAFRQWNGLEPNAYIPNIFDWLRDSGIRLFRRALDANSPISGLYVKHPDAGRCILINYSEDIYRQRFSAAHETGHALMDDGKPFNISHQRDQSSSEWEEIRANSFASAFLMPPELLHKMGTPAEWKNPEKLLQAANVLSVSIPALLSALKRDKIIDQATWEALRAHRFPWREKREPELADNLPERERDRKRRLLATGLHAGYVELGLEAHRQGLISLGKLAEMLLVESDEVSDLASLFGMSLYHG